MPAPLGNKFALGNTGGAPPHYATVEELKTACEGYFEFIDTNKEPASITGLMLFLGFGSASSFTDYCKRSEEFSYIIKRAKMIVEHAYELSLHNDKCTGAIFALKQMGWTDKIEQSGTVVNHNVTLTKEDIEMLSKKVDNDY